MLKHRFFSTQWLEIPIKVSFKLNDFDFKPQICQEPKKLAELEVRNFFGDFNARNKETITKIKAKTNVVHFWNFNARSN